MKRLLAYLLIVLGLGLVVSVEVNADDTNSNAKICLDLGFEVESEKYIKCKLDLENHYNKKESEILKKKLIQKSQKKNINIDFGCFNICKDSVKGMSISLVESFCRKQCKMD